MTKPVENDGTWNIYKDIVCQSRELEEDIRRMHGMIADAQECYEGIYERYCELPGWDLLDAQVSMAIGWPEVLLGVLPEEEK